jgi:hypothetical protein
LEEHIASIFKVEQLAKKEISMKQAARKEYAPVKQ